MNDPSPILEARNITVRFGKLTANDSVTLSVNRKEIFALVGENGAGKTTLMNVLYGLITPDSGEIIIRGKKTSLRSPADAIDARVGMVHQHFKLLPSFTVYENIFLGQEPKKLVFFYDKKAARKNTQKLCEKYGLSLDPDARVADLSVGLRQRVELLKTLSRGLDILILDEPTAVLTPDEANELFHVLRNMVDENDMTVILITHKLYEVTKYSDRVGVMRRGRLIGIKNTKDTDSKELARMMVGEDVSDTSSNTEKQNVTSDTPPMLDIRNLNVSDERGLLALKDVSLKVYPGEILGIAGVSGNGQTELSEAVTGMRPIISGDIYVNGVRTNGMTPKELRALHLVHIPEDRQSTGLSLPASIAENIVAGRQHEKRFKGHLSIQKRENIDKYSDDMTARFDIRGGDSHTKVQSLSGGNQQKLLTAREFSFEGCRLAIISQPTRGVDIGACAQIHNAILKKRDEGAAILLISSDLDELLLLSDRVVTMLDGKITAEFDPKVSKKEEIGHAMLDRRA